MIARANNPPRGPDIPTPRDDLRVRGRLAATPGRRTGPLATVTGMAGSCATRSGACGRCSGLQPPVRGGRSCRIDPTVQVRVTTSEPSGFGTAPRHDGPAADRTAPPVRCGRPPDGPEAGSRVATATLSPSRAAPWPRWVRPSPGDAPLPPPAASRSEDGSDGKAFRQARQHHGRSTAQPPPAAPRGTGVAAGTGRPLRRSSSRRRSG